MPRTNNGEFVTEASKMFQAGDDCWHVGQYDEARKKYLYAADLYHKTGDTEGEAFVYSRLGELELSLDNYKEAEKALRQSTALVENYIDGQNTYGEALIKLSKVQTASGEDVPSLSVRVPFAQVAQPLLADERFVQLHRSYVVNLAAVSQLAAGEFWMQSGARVPVPRGREPAARTALKDYLEKQFR